MNSIGANANVHIFIKLRGFIEEPQNLEVIERLGFDTIPIHKRYGKSRSKISSSIGDQRINPDSF